MIESLWKQDISLIEDPTLPHLITVMDTGAMAGHFSEFFRQNGIDKDWQVTDTAIEKVYYRPMKTMGILYRLYFQHASGEKAEEWIYAKMTRPGGLRKLQKKTNMDVAGYHPGQSFLAPMNAITPWEQFDMLLWLFPADPLLESLPQMTDFIVIRKLAEENIQVFSSVDAAFHCAPGHWRCKQFSFDRVKHMPGKRCVLRHHLVLENQDGETRNLTYYCKISKKSVNRTYYDLLNITCEQLAMQNSPVNIPHQLMYLDGYETVWQADWGGKAIIDVFEDYPTETLFSDIANMLAEFHKSRIEGLPDGVPLQIVLDGSLEDGAKLTYFLPQYKEIVAKVLERLSALEKTLSANLPKVMPVHGACRIEQMLVEGDELAIVDFDAIALGDPMYDVAEFIASLQYLEITQGTNREVLAKTAKVFYDAYAAQVDWKMDKRRLAWYALAFFLSKMYSSVKNYDLLAIQRMELVSKDVLNGWLEMLTEK